MLGKVHGRDVEAVNGEHGLGAAQVAFSHVDGDIAFFAWQ